MFYSAVAYVVSTDYELSLLFQAQGRTVTGNCYLRYLSFVEYNDRDSDIFWTKKTGKPSTYDLKCRKWIPTIYYLLATIRDLSVNFLHIGSP